MKRSLPQDDNCSGCSTTRSDELKEILQEQNKRIKRTPSGSGFAAVTLLSLAQSASSRKLQASIPHILIHMDYSANDRNLVPTFVLYDEEGDHEANENREDMPTAALSTGTTTSAPLPSERLAPLSVPYNIADLNYWGALSVDWRTAFKPLPPPPRLPRGLSAGNKPVVS